MFKKFRKWLRGEFVCIRCHRTVSMMAFGFGEAICPDCYNGEQPFIKFDDSYWLNKLIMRLNNYRNPIFFSDRKADT